jgi:hypothetical protein
VKLAEDLTPQGRDLEIIRALWRYRFLLTSQIKREWSGANPAKAASSSAVECWQEVP